MDPLIGNANRGSVSTVSREPEGYSCRFDAASSQKMVFGGNASVTGERRTNTMSFWVKRGNVSTNTYVWEWGETDSNILRMFFRFNSNNNYMNWSSSGAAFGVSANAFIDQSAWYHVVCSCDTDPATPVMKMWVNGLLNNTSSFTGSTDVLTGFGSSENHTLGWSDVDNTGYFDGYLAEFHAVGGAVLLPTAFGAFDSTGTWKPITYTGTSGTGSTSHGTNGFYLNFDDASDLGADSSGNGNDFTTSNMDTTNQTGDGPKNNFAVMNRHDMSVESHAALTITKGNLSIAASNSGYNNIRATQAAGSGKWYHEVKISAVSGTRYFINGIVDANWSHEDTTNSFGYNSNSLAYSVVSNGEVYNGTTSNQSDWDGISTGADVGDIFMVALDMTNGKFWIGRNGTWWDTNEGTADPATGAYPVVPNANGPTATLLANGFTSGMVGHSMYQSGTARTYEVNFGNPTFSITSGYSDGNNYGLFKYEPPTGFYAWCTKNLAQYG